MSLNNRLRTIKLKVGGLHCTACALNIDLDLEELPGVTKATTNYAKSETEVEFDHGKVSESQVIATITKTGYQVVNC